MGDVETIETKEAEAGKTHSDFSLDLSTIEDGQKKPIDTCKFIAAMNNWRERSRHSQLLVK